MEVELPVEELFWDLESLLRMLTSALMLLPLRAAMFSSWAHCAIESPVLLHWLVKVCPLLTVGVALAAELVLLENGEIVEVLASLELFDAWVICGTATAAVIRVASMIKNLECMLLIETLVVWSGKPIESLLSR